MATNSSDKPKFHLLLEWIEHFRDDGGGHGADLILQSGDKSR